MKLKNIFAKDIYRKINPAVVVTEKDRETIKTEIEEYVFTPDLIENLYKFLYDLLRKKEGKTGIWINGYYGSGKSHFIKYVHYCLNPETFEDAFDHFISNAKDHSDDFSNATPSNILQLKNQIQSSQVDNIMFNIDAVSGQREEPEKITRIILNQFNHFRGYNNKNISLAILVEKHLDKLGKFEEFKQEINEQGNYNWGKDAAKLVSLMLDTVLDVVLTLDNTLDRDSLRLKLKYPDDISIKGDLIPEFLDFLGDKSDNYRLIFLVDEVSQYIGTNTNLLLNLQTIIEEIGATCNNRIWFASTAQQTLDQVIGNADITDEDFGKIMGRFETRISLESQKADYITKIRILGKSSDGLGNLKTYYDKTEEAIENQFRFPHELYHGFENVEEFYLSYPFIPYQFRLISDVFESFSNLEYVIKEVRDNERSVLGITHYTVKNYGDKDVGYFIPFDAFFNKQFKQSLTHTARRIIERSNNLEIVQENPFSKRVVNVLFMVSNLTDTKKITFPVNLDNLTTLLMEEPDTNRLELQHQVQKVLDQLIQQNIIREEDGQYHFLKEDEIDVAAEIKNFSITMEDRLTALHDDVFAKMIRIQRKFGFGNNNFNLMISFDDKYIFNQGDISVTFSFYSEEDIHQKALGLNRNDLIFCINDKLKDNKNLKKEFNQFVKTKKYIYRHFDSATGTRRTTLDTFDIRNKNKLFEIRKKFEDLFKMSPVITRQSVLTADDLTSVIPQTRYDDTLKLHFKSIYKKQDLVQGYANNNDELKLSANNQQITTIKSLTHAEEEVNNWVSNTGDPVSVDDIIKHFSKPPYGWKDLSTTDVLIHLAQKDKRQFEWRNERIDLPTFYQKVINRNERMATIVKPTPIIDIIDIQKAITNYRSIFNDNLDENEEPNRIHQEMTNKLSKKAEHSQPFAKEYFRQPFGKHFQGFADNLNELSNIRDPQRLFEKLDEIKDELKAHSDNCKELQEFVESQFSNYKIIGDFVHDNEQNFTNLDETHCQTGQELLDYFKNEDLPSGKFPQIRQAYKELQTAIKILKDDLVKQTVVVYSKVYDEVEEKIITACISEPPFPKRENKLNQIKREENISKLKLELANSATFRGECLKIISEKSGKKSVVFKISQSGLPSQIENEEQLEDYISKLKKKLQKELKEGKTIIIG